MNEMVLIIERQSDGNYNGNIWGPMPRSEALNIVAQMTNDLTKTDLYASKQLTWELRKMNSIPKYPTNLFGLGYYEPFPQEQEAPTR